MDAIKSRYFPGISFIAATVLCLQITLTRYFSITQNYHFAFWVISIAFLGYGASGSFLFSWKKALSFQADKFFAIGSLLFSMSILFSFLLTNLIPFDFYQLPWNKNQIFWVIFYYFVLSLPFFFGGLIISSAVSRFPFTVHKIYFSDLVGAGIGSLAASFIFLIRGERGVFILLSGLGLFASFCFSSKKMVALRLIILTFLISGSLILYLSPSWLSFRISSYKSLPLALKYPKAKLLATRWNAISRVDIFESPGVRYAPGLSLLYGDGLPHQAGLAVDGGELSAITESKDCAAKNLSFLNYLPSAFAYNLVSNPRTLIIEPKGGLDVLMACFFQAPQIKVIESNPLIVDFLRQDFAPLTGNLYRGKNIHVLSVHPRSVLKGERGIYDLIIFSLTDVFGASGTGVYGFNENYLFTLDCFSEVLRILSPHGVAGITVYLLPPPRQELKLLATWIEALERNHLDSQRHLVAMRSWGTISYFIKKSPFTAEEIKILRTFAEERFFDLVYCPGIQPDEVNLYNQFERPIYYEAALSLFSPVKRKKFYTNYLFEVRPATDNRPFFGNFFRLRKWKETYQALGEKWLPLLQEKFLIPILLLQAIFLAFLFILTPLFFFSPAQKEKKKIFGAVFFYFFFLGAAFMFIEVTLIQKFILFLGHPLYSVSTIIFSLLFSSGIGSLSSTKIFSKNLRARGAIAIFSCLVLIFLSFSLLPLFFESFITQKLFPRILLTFLFVLPLGFFMGIPFPTGIRLLEAKEQALIPWAWAINAFSSVIHSTAVLLVAIGNGYNFALLLGGGFYLLALPFLSFAHHRNKSHI